MRQLPPLSWPRDVNVFAFIVCFALTWIGMLTNAIATWMRPSLLGGSVWEFLLGLVWWGLALAFATFLSIGGAFVPFAAWLTLRCVARSHGGLITLGILAILGTATLVWRTPRSADEAAARLAAIHAADIQKLDNRYQEWIREGPHDVVASYSDGRGGTVTETEPVDLKTAYERLRDAKRDLLLEQKAERESIRPHWEPSAGAFIRWHLLTLRHSLPTDLRHNAMMYVSTAGFVLVCVYAAVKQHG